MPLPSYWLVMPAAGAGARMGAPDGPPKQYRRIAGRSVIEHALAAFIADPHCQGIVVALRPGDVEFRALALAAEPRLRTVDGGALRAASVAAGLAAVAATCGDADPWVLVHDAARPCLASADLAALLGALERAPDGALLGVPIADTVKRADAGGRVVATLPREGLWRASTPQAFRLARLRAALAATPAATDEASAVEALGDRPALVAGSALNIKITTAADLEFAARVLSGGRP